MCKICSHCSLLAHPVLGPGKNLLKIKDLARAHFSGMSFAIIQTDKETNKNVQTKKGGHDVPFS